MCNVNTLLSEFINYSMRFNTKVVKKNLNVLVCFVVFFVIIACQNSTKKNESQYDRGDIKNTLRADEIRLKGLEIYKSYPDSAINYIKESIKISIKLNDNLRTAKGYNCLGLVYKVKSDFKKSFSLYKNALKILDTLDSNVTKSAVYNNLGLIYMEFGKYNLAEEHYLTSIELLKKKEGSTKEKFLNNTLMNLSLTYRYKGEYRKSLQYVKMAIASLENSNIDPQLIRYRNAEALMKRGMVYLKMGKYEKAKELLVKNYLVVEESEELAAIIDASYYLGSLYMATQEYDRAKFFFSKAIGMANSIGDLQYKKDILLDLGVIANKQGYFEEAYEYLRKGNILKDSLFGVKNTWSLYELKENHEIEKQAREIVLMQKEKRIEEIKKTVYFFGVLMFCLFGFLYFRYIKLKYVKEKKIVELELDKTKEVVTMKNKELTTSALQIIENGEIIKHFKSNIEEIKKEMGVDRHPKLDALLASMTTTTKMNWKEFKLRFELVNKEFFKKIKEEYPRLSPTELKLCAFLKLNFSSKDIASLMGISDQSVKTSRYRIRKKFNLSRDINLVDFISKF